MHLGTAIPWWGLALWAAAIAALATFAYRRVGALSPRQRLHPDGAACAGAGVRLAVPAATDGARHARRSRGWNGRDPDRPVQEHGASRCGRALASRARRRDLAAAPAVAGARWKVETWLFGDGLHDAHDVAMSPTANRSDLATDSALRWPGSAPHGLSGLVVLTDGARTDTADLGALGRQLGVPVVAIGIGRADAAGHRHPQRGDRGVEPRCQPRGSGRRHRRARTAEAVRSPASPEWPRRRAADAHAGQRRRAAARHVHRRSRSRIAHGLHARRAGRRRRADGWQQPRVRPRAAARTTTSRARARGIAGFRAHVPDARVDRGSRRSTWTLSSARAATSRATTPTSCRPPVRVPRR